MNELERLPEGGNKITDFQKKYNLTSKSIVHVIGTNISLFMCILLPLLLIGFIWTDFGMPKFGVKYITDGLVTVAMLVIGEVTMMRIGADGGKLDAEYVGAREAFLELVDRVNSIGTMFIGVFCEWQIDNEFEQALTARLRALRFTRADWEKIKYLTYDELEKKYGKRKALQISSLHRLEPIQLNEAILLFDNEGDALARGGVPISGAMYIKKKAYSWKTLLSCVFAGLITVSVAITLTADISFGRVMYTFFKLVVLLSRMATGYATGARAYNTIDVRQLKAKCNYLRLYERFVSDKTYLKLGNRYGDISCFIADEDKTATIGENIATATKEE